MDQRMLADLEKVYAELVTWLNESAANGHTDPRSEGFRVGVNLAVTLLRPMFQPGRYDPS